MKKFNRFLSFLLIIAISLSLVFVSVEADDTAPVPEEPAVEESAVEESATEAEETESAAADDPMDLMDFEEVYSETLSYINPIYADVLSEADLVQSSSEMTLFDASTDYIDTLEEAGDILRAGFAAREATTEITFDRKNGYFVDMDLQDIFDEIIAEALIETDDPACGDYLRYQYGGSSAGYSYTSSWGKLTITSTYYTTAEQEAVVTSTVNDVIGVLDLDGKDEDYKVAKIYDYITSHVVYDYTNLENDSYLLKYTAYAALINGTSVCQGYANLFYRLCREAGLSARIVSGTGNGGPHAWNIIRIGNLYYDVDSTWDAEESPSQYAYFLKCDANFGGHVRGSFDADTDYASAAFYAAYPMSDTDYGYPESAKIAVTGLSLSYTAQFLLPGENCTITAEVLPADAYDRTVTWSFPELTVGFSRSYTGTYCTIAPTGNEGYIVVTATTNDGNYSDSLTVYVSETPHVHTEEVIPGVDATCTEPGLTDGVICSVCGEILVEQMDIAAYGHTEEVLPEVPPTSTETGLTEGLWCPICGEIFVEQEVIPATGSGDEPTIIASGSCGKNAFWSLNDEGLLTISGEGEMYDFEAGPDNNPWAAYYDSITSIHINEGVTYIGDGAFSYCGAATNVDIPSGVTGIGARAFYGCKSLTGISIPIGVTSLGDCAFGNCSKLKSIELPEGITIINSWTFQICEELETVILPASITKIDRSAFAICYDIKNVYYAGTEEQWNSIVIEGDNDCINSANIHYIVNRGSCGNAAFWVMDDEGMLSVFGSGEMDDYTVLGDNPWAAYHDTITSIRVDSGITHIGNLAFSYCWAASSIELPAGLIGIGSGAFHSCASLNSIDIPSSVISIGGDAFGGCNNLVSIEWPENVTVIENWTFQMCRSLSSINIPASVVSIGNGSFYDCRNLTDVFFSGTEEEWNAIQIGNDNECLSNSKIHFSAVNTVASGTCGDNVTWKLDSDGVMTISGTGDMYNGEINGQTGAPISIPWYGYRNDINKLIINNGVTHIGNSLFVNCSNLNSIVFPENNLTIGRAAFAMCVSLNNLVLPDYVTSIGGGAFNGCSSLKDITLSSSLTSIGSNTFNSCSALEHIIIPEGVVSIGEEAFCECINMKSIELPLSLDSIGFFAFGNCDALTDVYYMGTENEWNNIAVIPGENMCLMNAHIHYDCINYIVDEGTCGSNADWTVTNEGMLIISGNGSMDDYAVLGGTPWAAYNDIITSIKVDTGITHIGNLAFSNCWAASSIELPIGLTSIGSGVFRSCASLNSIDIPSSVTSIGGDAFGECSSLRYILWPENTAVIENWTFQMCESLESIILPEIITSIGNGAFYNCDKLANVFFSGTEEQWGEIQIGYDNECLSNAEKIFSGDTVVAEGSCGNNLTWKLDNNGIMTISGIGDMDDYDGIETNRPWESYISDIHFIIIENMVSGIGYAAFGGSINLENVVIGTSIKRIGYAAFAGCTGLETVVIPDNVESLGGDAFGDCTSLRNIVLSRKLSYINYYTFGNCSSLESIIIPEGVTGIDSYAFDSCRNLKSIILPSTIDYIGEMAFGSCISLESISIPEGVTSISQYTFSNCVGLNSIVLPSTLIPGQIMYSAFLNCDNLANVFFRGSTNDWNQLMANLRAGNNALRNADVDYYYDETNSNKCGKNVNWTLNNGVLTIYGEGDMYHFDPYCEENAPWYLSAESIDTVIVEEGVTCIGSYAFEECINMSSAELPDSLSSVGFKSFYNCNSLIDIIIPEEVVEISSSAFEGCSSLQNIIIPYSITRIEGGTFKDCISLESVDIPDSVKEIGSGAFMNCQSLNDISIPDGITYIDSNLFNNCISLENVTIPDSVRKIDFSSFYGCSNLTEIIIPDSVNQIGYNAFGNCSSLKNINIPYGVEIIESGVFDGCNSLISIEIPESVTSIGDYAFYGCSSLKHINIPNNVSSIGDYAFYGCNSLLSVNIPNNVSCINRYTFWGCSSLPSISIPEGITSIGERAFAGCSSLTEIVIPDNVISIGNYAFGGCSQITSLKISNSLNRINADVFYGCSSLLTVSIPEGVRTIGYEAFGSCDMLKTIIIPSSVSSVETRAFYNCNKVSDIYYYGTSGRWNRLPKGSYNYCLSRAIIHFKGADCVGYTVSLNNSISLNFYYDIGEELLQDNSAKVLLKKDNNIITELPITDTKQVFRNGSIQYMFSYELATKELSDIIEAEIVDASGYEYNVCTYSAKQYCEDIISMYTWDDNSADLVALVKALMNYGAAAQMYFGYNTDNLVNSSLSEEDKVIEIIADDSLSHYATIWYFWEPVSNDISCQGVSLDLLADLNMKLYFYLPSGRAISDYTFTITDNADNPVVLETGTGENGSYARISNIYSVDIDAEYIVNIYDGGQLIGQVKTSPFAYINSSMKQDDLNEDLRMLLYAMYYYNSCADAYFD